MRRAIVCLLVACGSHAPAPTPPAKSPTATAGSGDECRPAEMPGDDSHEIAVFCNHNPSYFCCGSGAAFGEWNCNNVAYVGWYGEYCRK